MRAWYKWEIKEKLSLKQCNESIKPYLSFTQAWISFNGSQNVRKRRRIGEEEEDHVGMEAGGERTGFQKKNR